MKARRRNELEQLLSVFDQNHRTSDLHILNVSETDFPEKFRPIIRRLKGAVSDYSVKKQMKEEDGFLLYMKDFARSEMFKMEQEKGETIRQQTEKMKEQEKIIQENKRVLQEKENAIQEQERAMQEQERAMQETKNAMQEQARVIAALQAQLSRENNASKNG